MMKVPLGVNQVIVDRRILDGVGVSFVGVGTMVLTKHKINSNYYFDDRL